jgi:hypothetical protein
VLQWHKWETICDFKCCRSKCGRYVVRRMHRVEGQKMTNRQRHLMPYEAMTIGQDAGKRVLIAADPTRPTSTSEDGAKRICEQAERERLATLEVLHEAKPRTLFQS